MGSQQSIDNVSRIVNNNVSSTINQTLINITNNTTGIVSGSQSVSISDITCKGNITIGPITQKQVIRYDLTRLVRSDVYSDITKAIEVGLLNSMAADTEITKGALALSTDPNISNVNESVTNLVNNIANTYKFENFSNDMLTVNANQSASIKNIFGDGDCNIGAISQDAVLTAVSKTIAENITNTVMKLAENVKVEQDTQAKNTVTQTGLLEDFFGGLSDLVGSAAAAFWIIILVIIAVVFGFGYLIYSIFSSGSEPDAPKKTDSTETNNQEQEVA